MDLEENLFQIVDEETFPPNFVRSQFGNFREGGGKNESKIGSVSDIHQYVSYDLHSKCAMFTRSWRMFHIPRIFS